MELKNYINVYDNILTPKQVSALLRHFQDAAEFEPAKVIKNEVSELDTKERFVADYNLKTDKSFTETHWFNFIMLKLKAVYEHYKKRHGLHYTCFKCLEITMLKYEEGGFYTIHSDSSHQIHREFSVSIFLNNDYEGGTLEFFDPSHKHSILKVEPQVGRVVMWPSNLFFPHRANTVTKGTRYAIVSWMI